MLLKVVYHDLSGNLPCIELLFFVHLCLRMYAGSSLSCDVQKLVYGRQHVNGELTLAW